MDDKKFLLVEKYRPSTIEECILPESIKKTFQEFIDKKELPNLLLHGKSGVGKTSVAIALCKELGYSHLLINASEEGNIDTLRTKIKNFASTNSWNQTLKVVILDESDFLTANTQPALRGFIEEYSDNCRFILTCNYPSRIIEALHSRCVSIDFKIPANEGPVLAQQFLKRLLIILEKEKIEYDKPAVVGLIKKFWPDFRKILNEIQRYSVSGKIDAGIMTSIEEINFKELMTHMKSRDIREMKKWVIQNLDSDVTSIVRLIYDNIGDELSESSQYAEVILVLAEYQYKHSFAADPEVNLTAMLLEIASIIN